MSWSRVELGKVCSKIGSGATPKGGKSVYIDFGVHQIRSQNIHNLQFDYGGLACITNDAANKLSSVTVEPRDVLLNITGDSVARVCQVPENVLPARVNQHVAIVRPENNQIRPEFLVYYLASPLMQSCMLQLANGKGASRNALTKEMIAAFEVPCPPLEIQDAIVDVLSVYDNLIENNRRQIKLLEEAAQRLYKEWFIDLNFPGHKNAKIVDGVPEGWSRIRLKDLAPFRRGKVITAKVTQPGKIPVVAGGLGPAYYHSKSNAAAPVITISGSGANAGFTRLYHQDIWASDCSYLSSSDTPYIYFVYLCVKVLGRGFKHLQCGSAQPHVYPSHINDLEILQPDASTLKKFECIANLYYEKTKYEIEQISEAQEARNRLLPKLMSGEIEV